ncbi:ribulose-phosphate 3-epimerase [Rhodobacter ferrooxidans]|uniref:Ribulose-phosphate 3-epimerase n=1 Tax=Rhodobacter ferrooxidans TaxID=371731 RepID=C8S4J0_9RHOB|nr:ribulose-phosphate 3-epimerase [Rhodobacter sp. SW2]EEW24073.1 Ribulose-phosphate 3-epimerase [Rhodobacter sp. SW2]
MAPDLQPLRKRCSGISAGLFAASSGRLEAAADQLRHWGGGIVHFDVMDGEFVPQITGGPAFLAVSHNSLLRDVHLMVALPERQIEAFARAGADILTVHAEAAGAAAALAAIRAVSERLGRAILAGLAVMPGTALEQLEPLLALQPDLILVLSLDPRNSLPADLPAACARLAALRAGAAAGTVFAIDGGITEATVAQAAACGPDVIVSGSAIFGAADPAAAFGRLTDAWAEGRRKLAEAADGR